MKNVSANDSEYVLDSFAVIALFNEEPGGAIVREMLEYAKGRQQPLLLSVVNLSECLYIIERRAGQSRADTMFELLRYLPIQIVDAGAALAVAAAKFKAVNKMSLADAFAAALAVEKAATLVTGDPEFQVLEKTIPIRWLPERKRRRMG